MKIEIGNIRIRIDSPIYVSRIVDVEGINSKIGAENHHILLWDFDDVVLRDLELELMSLQIAYKLPTIYIVESSTAGHYHAYAFAKKSLPETLLILSSTNYLCQTYFKIGVMRGYWTLRISPEKGQFRLVSTIKSNVPECDLSELTTLRYRTAK